MPALEYLSQNSLVSYPLKSGLSRNANNPVAEDWFCDILFVPYISSIRRVYISSIAKLSDSELRISFANAETLQDIHTQLTIAGTDFVEHVGNMTVPFFVAQNDEFSVKIILGAGLIKKEPFSQTYSVQETELVSCAVIPYRQSVTSISFERYEIDQNPNATYTINLENVHTFTHPEVPSVETRYNTTSTQESDNSCAIDVLAGTGAGLYDACSTSNTPVCYINSVPPNSDGAFFINTSACYTFNALTESQEYTLGSALDPYRMYDVILSDTETVTKDIVSARHSFMLENYCKPKCPPENLRAFAYYLNRITDAANELTLIAHRDQQTFGLGYVYGDPTTFKVDTYDFQSSTPFQECTSISRSSGFLKYFHEFRTLQIYYDALTIREYEIVAVIDSNTVALATAPTQADDKLPFRLLDAGTLSNMNCAIDVHNQITSTYNKPYFKVKYTTSESYDTTGQYVTYLSISVALFNPSPDLSTLHVVFDTQDNAYLKQQGIFKIRKKEIVEQSDDPVVDLDCREYAFVEGVFSINCGELGGYVDIKIFDTTDQENITQLGDTFILSGISGATCPGGVTGGTEKFRVLQPDAATFSADIQVDSSSTEATLYSGGIPSWLTYNPTIINGTLKLQGSDASADTISGKYYLSFKISGGVVNGAIIQVIIDYVALPEIKSPLGSVYTTTHPLIVDKLTTYTDESPMLEIRANNMRILSNDYPEDQVNFFYTLIGAPDGLVFNSSTGKLTGKISDTVAAGEIFSISISASNSAGVATNPQVFNVLGTVVGPPIIYFE